MKNIVVMLSIKDAKDKQKVLKAVSTLTGINSLSADIKAGKLTIVGEVDPVDIIAKLRNKWGARLDSVGEPEKKAEKKEEKKDDKKKDDEKKDMNDHVAELVNAYKNYNPCMTQYYVVHSVEENPNSCVIC